MLRVKLGNGKEIRVANSGNFVYKNEEEALELIGEIIEDAKEESEDKETIRDYVRTQLIDEINESDVEEIIVLNELY